MTTSKFTQPDMATQDAVSYKANIDACVAVMARQGAGFAPHATDTPGMSILIDAGAIYSRATGGYTAVAQQSSGTLNKPGSNSWIARISMSEAGALTVTYGTASASPVAPAYPAGAIPLAQVLIASSASSLTNAVITDERAWNSGYGAPRNTFLITSSTTFAMPANAKFCRITAAGGGGGGGAGASSAADATKYAGGGGGGAGSVLSRLWGINLVGAGAESLAIVIGAGGTGGTSATAAGGVTGQVAATAGGATTVTGSTSGFSVSCAGGGAGGSATAAANGAAGSAGAAGTGVAGTAGSTGVAGTNGGKGGGTGTGGLMSPVGAGAVLATTRTGSAGQRGAGGGGAIGYSVGGGDKGGNGGDGFVLIEVF